jgi:hypothetical protein
MESNSNSGPSKEKNTTTKEESNGSVNDNIKEDKELKVSDSIRIMKDQRIRNGCTYRTTVSTAHTRTEYLTFLKVFVRVTTTRLY